MKLSAFLMMIFTMNVFATGFGQFSFKAEDKKVREVLDIIEQNSNYRFFYNDEFESIDKVVNLKVENENINQVLDRILATSDYTYSLFENNLIVISLKNNVREQSNLQQNIVRGTVKDEEGNPIPGASVVLKGTTQGTTTDINGNYIINVVDPQSVLVFSFIGYINQEITVGTKTQINVSLAEEVVGLEEVVVIGYGVQKKVNVIGSVSTVSNKEFSVAPVSTVSNAIVGRLPGAIIMQKSGEPGLSDAEILIRGIATLGNTSPLVVVDGIAGRDLNSLEPTDIESISILKDASAAIYGAAAANGVILVTTKRGTEGGPTLQYEFFEGLRQPTIVPKLQSAAEFATITREHEQYLGTSETNMTYSLDDIEKYKQGGLPWLYPNTDWWAETYKKWSNTRHHAASVYGGTRNTNYYFSLGYQFDNGLEKNSAFSFNRFNLKSALDFKINKYLSVGFDVNGSQENKMGGSQESMATMYGVVLTAPTSPAFFPNGLPGPDRTLGWNPVVVATDATGFNDNKVYRLNNKINATFKVPKIDSLWFSGYYAYDLFFEVDKHFEKPWTLYDIDKSNYLAAGNSGKEDGSAFLKTLSRGSSEPNLTDSYNNFKRETFNIQANYEKTFNSVHNVNAFIGFETSDYMHKGISAYRRYFISDRIPYLFAGGDEQKTNSGTVSIDARANYFGRLSYNFKETYLFQFTFRRDGSLRFSKEAGRWGNFPGVLIGWRISNEDFWQKRLSFIDFFKLKASWGQLGNDNVAAFQYLTSYSFGTGMATGPDRRYSAGLYQSNIPNPYITWEVANIYNTGFESRFFDSKFEFNADFFYQRRDNILVKRNASVPTYVGLSLPDENFGIVDVKGTELVLGYNSSRGQLRYSIRGNFSYTHNKIIEYDEPTKTNEWQTLTGHPIGSKLLYNVIGVFHDTAEILTYPHFDNTRPGDVIIEDYNGDKKITLDDQIVFDRTADPRITYSLNLNLTYKNWDLSALLYGVGDCLKQKNQGNYALYSEGRWTKDNPTSDKPRTSSGYSPYVEGGANSFHYLNSSYFRMKNLYISYTIPNNIVRSIYMKNAMVYLSGENLFLLSKLRTPVDPELGQVGNQFSNYPIARIVSLGVKVTF